MTLDADWEYLLKRLNYSKTKGGEKRVFPGTTIYLGDHQPDFEEWERIIKLFPCKDPQAYIMRQSPGQVMPLHRDEHGSYRRLFGKHTETVRRWWIPLRDRQPGHILEVDGQLMDWKAGDTIEIVGKHGTATIGSTPRYCLIITGVN